MLRYPCLVLDHDDTVVQSEATINYPYFSYILDFYRPGTRITLEEYINGCYHQGFAQMCRSRYGFTDEELVKEYAGWQDYIKDHIPSPFSGIEHVIHRQKALGGRICVVSHSASENISRDYAVHFGVQPDRIFGWDYPECQRKPNPWPLQQIMKDYGLKSSQLLVVDDMKPAWEMAQKAKVPIAYAGWARDPSLEVSAEMKKLCDFSFSSPKALENFLFDY